MDHKRLGALLAPFDSPSPLAPVQRAQGQSGAGVPSREAPRVQMPQQVPRGQALMIRIQDLPPARRAEALRAMEGIARMEAGDPEAFAPRAPQWLDRPPRRSRRERRSHRRREPSPESESASESEEEQQGRDERGRFKGRSRRSERE
jgi:hypothetical protein